jgi:hypothetical protein
MCLIAITETYNPPLAEEREAWKVFIQNEGGLLPEFYTHLGDYIFKGPIGESKTIPYLPLNTWIPAVNKTVSNNYVTYHSGFHAFENWVDAEAWASEEDSIVVKVRLRGIRIRGMQDDSLHGYLPTLVADEMFIPSQVSR